jgi:hypothetical protein
MQILSDNVGFAQGYLPTSENTADLEADFDAIRTTGAQWVRFDFAWSLVQGAGPKSFNWYSLDRAVKAARSRGLKVLGILTYTPSWARPKGATDKHYPLNTAAFGSFVRAAVLRYSPQGVRTWEIWNEPNIAAFWEPAPDPSVYAALLRASFATIKAADPNAVVLVGGLAGVGSSLDWEAADGSELSPWRFLSDLYTSGAKGSFDAVADHPYAPLPKGPEAAVPGNSFLQVSALHQLMALHGDGAKQIWATEVGSYTGSSQGAVSGKMQGNYVRQYLRDWTGWSFAGPIFFYTLRDTGTNPAERDSNWGFLRSNRSRKPAFDVIRQALTVGGSK